MALHVSVIELQKQQVWVKGVTPLGPVWYMCLKTENCCLKTFMEIHVSEKVY